MSQVSKSYLFYFASVRFWYAGKGKPIAIGDSPESRCDVDKGSCLKMAYVRIRCLVPVSEKLTNAAEIVESSMPHFCFLLILTHIRTQSDKNDQLRNNAVAILSHDPRLSDILGENLLARGGNSY